MHTEKSPEQSIAADTHNESVGNKTPSLTSKIKNVFEEELGTAKALLTLSYDTAKEFLGIPEGKSYVSNYKNGVAKVDMQLTWFDGIEHKCGVNWPADGILTRRNIRKHSLDESCYRRSTGNCQAHR